MQLPLIHTTPTQTGFTLPNKLESPELLYPGRKPVGDVRIDWEHPLARGLRVLYLPQGASSIPDVTGNLPPFQSPDSDTRAGPNGLATGFSTAYETESHIGVVEDYKFPFTIAMRVRMDASSNDTSEMCGYDGGDDEHAYFEMVAWQISFDYVGSWTSAKITLTRALAIGEDYLLIFRSFSGTDHRLTAHEYTTGWQDEDVNNTDLGAKSLSEGISNFGFAHQSPVVGRRVSAVYVWKEALSDVLVASLIKDPYQFLKPVA
jgi:hypothetical protein